MDKTREALEAENSALRQMLGVIAAHVVTPERGAQHWMADMVACACKVALEGLERNDAEGAWGLNEAAVLGAADAICNQARKDAGRGE